MDNASQVGSLLTDLPQPSIEDLPKLTLGAPMTSTEVAALKETAARTIPALPLCDEKHFIQCFRVLQAALPRKSSDELSGELLVAAYRRKLGHLSKAAISHLADQALDKCHWFPTIAECLEIVAGWERDDRGYMEIMNARARLQRHAQEEMEAAMRRLRDEPTQPEDIAALPDQWQRIAETRGLIRWSDGRYVQRLRVVEP